MKRRKRPKKKTHPKSLAKATQKKYVRARKTKFLFYKYTKKNTCTFTNILMNTSPHTRTHTHTPTNKLNIFLCSIFYVTIFCDLNCLPYNHAKLKRAKWKVLCDFENAIFESVSYSFNKTHVYQKNKKKKRLNANVKHETTTSNSKSLN